MTSWVRYCLPSRCSLCCVGVEILNHCIKPPKTGRNLDISSRILPWFKLTTSGVTQLWCLESRYWVISIDSFQQQHVKALHTYSPSLSC